MIGNCYVTTSIPYVNARPHVGFALELVQADAIARYHRLLGRPTRFQTGTDENAFKNVLAARQRGLAVQEFVSANSTLFRRLCTALNASPDDFLRTTEPRHVAAVGRLWASLRPDDVYRARYRGAYCTGCEDFLQNRDLLDGCCPEHRVPPAPVDEENYFFRLSAYQRDLHQLIAADRIRVIPAKRKREVLAFITAGLHDFSISRNAARADGWGIAVPGDPSQVVYVWIDALANYLSGLGFGTREDWTSYWAEDTLKIHVIGKNVWKFHAVYWPALLLSARLPLPNHIVVHGFLTEQGRKISKSLGSVADPFSCVQDFGADAVRYYLLRGASPFADSDFSIERLKLIYNTDLANNLGNLVSRLTTLCAKAAHPGCRQDPAPEAPPHYHRAFEAYALDKALDALWAGPDRINREIEDLQPWKAIERGNGGQIASHLTTWLREVHRTGYWLAPFLPGASQAVLSAVGRRPVQPSGVLFPRLL